MGDLPMKKVEEVASIFDVHFRTVYEWIKHRQIRTVKIGKRFYIKDEEIAYIQENGLRSVNNDD